MFKIKWAANIAAAVLLGGSLVYYNFVDKAPQGVSVGNYLPAFSAQIYEVDGDTFTLGEERFSVAEKTGKVCVVNFWSTICIPCIEELPEFNEIQEKFGNAVEIIAIAGAQDSAEYAAKWLTEKKWTKSAPDTDWADYSIRFGYLPEAACKEMGVQTLPRTIVVDKLGVITHVQDEKMAYADLYDKIEKLL